MGERVCKWYFACPMKRFYEEGRLEAEWIERFCKGDYLSCVRYRMEESGQPHVDYMLPNGELRPELQSGSPSR
ncbi:MAG: uracil-DNA glycosylase [Chloroflexota bacterium]|nr:uracil-DNA glycosylase [Chloroflexota bacterium]